MFRFAGQRYGFTDLPIPRWQWPDDYRKRALDAEARIRAVEELLDKKERDLDAMGASHMGRRSVLIEDVRRALRRSRA